MNLEWHMRLEYTHTCIWYIIIIKYKYCCCWNDVSCHYSCFYFMGIFGEFPHHRGLVTCHTHTYNITTLYNIYLLVRNYLFTPDGFSRNLRNRWVVYYKLQYSWTFTRFNSACRGKRLYTTTPWFVADTNV